jgi:hypothetical protein
MDNKARIIAMPSGKLLVDEVRAIVDGTVAEILKSEGPGAELSFEKIMAAFERWVLPDHHLDVIRERLAFWQARRKSSLDPGPEA